MNSTMNHSVSYHKPAVQTETVALPEIPPSITPEMVNAVVEEEVEREMALYNDQEEAFVEQCLKINPVEYISRPSCRSNPETTDAIKLQKNIACRRSRINGKIKKAKLKYQNQFIAIKMQQRAVQLQLWKQMIADAEIDLLKRGYSLSSLKRLRTLTGMDKVKPHGLDQLSG